jgi:hypothetical protein
VGWGSLSLADCASGTFPRTAKRPPTHINEKGNRHRTIGIHFASAAEAISEYIAKAELKTGSLFRARRAPRVDELGERPMSKASMYRVVANYLERLSGAVKEGVPL